MDIWNKLFLLLLEEIHLELPLRYYSMCIQYIFSCLDLHFFALQECQDDQRSQALPSQQWRGT